MRSQPVFAGDIAAAIAKAVDGDAKPGTVYELGGPEVRTFKELMEFILATIERRRLLVPVPFPLMKLQATFLQFLPNPPLTPDQVEMLKADNIVCRGRARAGPHPRGPRHHSQFDGVGGAGLSLAIPQDRPVPRPHGLERDELSFDQHPALAFCLSMIFSENRIPLFRIMLLERNRFRLKRLAL